MSAFAIAAAALHCRAMQPEPAEPKVHRIERHDRFLAKRAARRNRKRCTCIAEPKETLND